MRVRVAVLAQVWVKASGLWIRAIASSISKEKSKIQTM